MVHYWVLCPKHCALMGGVCAAQCLPIAACVGRLRDCCLGSGDAVPRSAYQPAKSAGGCLLPMGKSVHGNFCLRQEFNSHRLHGCEHGCPPMEECTGECPSMRRVSVTGNICQCQWGTQEGPPMGGACTPPFSNGRCVQGSAGQGQRCMQDHPPTGGVPVGMYADTGECKWPRGGEVCTAMSVDGRRVYHRRCCSGECV